MPFPVAILLAILGVVGALWALNNREGMAPFALRVAGRALRTKRKIAAAAEQITAKIRAEADKP